MDRIRYVGRYLTPAQSLKSDRTYSEGDYHRYLESLSPDFDRLLAYSRYDKIKHELHDDTQPHFAHRYSTRLVHVIDILKQGGTKNSRPYNGMGDKSMAELHDFLSKESDSESDIRLRIIYAQHLTGPSIEALGSALSLDPNVLSCYIGNSFKASAEHVGRCVNCPDSVNCLDTLGNSKIPAKYSMGYLVGSNMDYHVNDNSVSIHDPLVHSLYSTKEHSTTFSIYIPRTIYAGSAQYVKLPASDLMLQEPALSYRIPQDGSVPSTRKFKEFDTLQHATIHLDVKHSKKGYRQVIVLFPPSPNTANEDRRPHPHLDPMSGKHITESFDEFRRSENRGERVPQRAHRDSFVDDIVNLAQSNAELKPAHVAHIVRLYALHQWVVRIRTLEDQLENLTVNCLISCKVQKAELDSPKYSGGSLLLDEEGMKNAILRYISALDEEIERLDLDKSAAANPPSPSPDDGPDFPSQLNETSKKYIYIRRRMEHLLSRVQHSLEVKNTKINRDLTNLQIEESRKSIEQAETVKRLTILAFIYIPLSCVSSVFGMNVREMDPQPSIWVFAVVAAVVTLATVATAIYAHIIKVLRYLVLQVAIAISTILRLTFVYVDAFPKKPLKYMIDVIGCYILRETRGKEELEMLRRT